MNLDETGALLTYVVSLDPTWSTQDPYLMQSRVNAWAAVLQDVPLLWARDFVTRHYGKPDAGQVKPAHLLTGWRTAERVEAAREPAPMLFGSTVPEGLLEVVAASKARWDEARKLTGAGWRQARDEARSVDAGVEMPWTVVVQVNPRERQCRFHKTCICTHSSDLDGCMDGWMNTPDESGRERRCPTCAEAMEMAAELTPKRKGRR